MRTDGESHDRARGRMQRSLPRPRMDGGGPDRNVGIETGDGRRTTVNDGEKLVEDESP